MEQFLIKRIQPTPIMSVKGTIKVTKYCSDAFHVLHARNYEKLETVFIKEKKVEAEGIPKNATSTVLGRQLNCFSLEEWDGNLYLVILKKIKKNSEMMYKGR